MKKIYYWEQSLILKGLLDYQTLLQDVLQKLLNAEYASADLEQIQHGRQSIYSARINDKARVIFTNFEKDRQKSLLILDVLENHEYERCLFLDKQYIRHFFGHLSLEQVSTAPVEKPDAFENVKIQDGFCLQRLHYFQNQWIELSPNQHDALQVSLPALIEGEAGSGKTCVGLCALSDYLNHHDAEQVQVLYLAPYAHLTTEMQQQWQGLNGDRNAQFKTYDEFFTKPLFENESLMHWISRQQAFPETASYRLLQEFSLLQLLEDEAAYSCLGERETIFPAEQRTKVWQLFQAFKSHFDFKENYHPWFSQLPISAGYDFIYLDESQSFTAYQLQQILALAKDRAVLLGFDRHQRIGANKRNILQFKNFCYKNDISLQNIQLYGSFRCPKQVIQLVNNILSIKYTLAQGRPDKGSILKYESHKEEIGQVLYFLESKDKKQFLDLLPQGRPNWAVVTPEIYKTKAKALFDTPLIFSPQECLGLGYDVIILYHMGQQSVIEDIAQALPKEIQKPYVHGARTDLHEEYLRSLNEWLIASSRAQNTVFIIEPSAPKVHKIMNFHHYLFQGNVLQSEVNISIDVDLDHDWDSEVVKLLSTGHELPAQEAYLRYVYPRTQMSIEAWLAHRKQKNEAIVPHSIKKEAAKASSPTTDRQNQKSSPQKNVIKNAHKNSLPSATLNLKLLNDLGLIEKAIKNRRIYGEKLKLYFNMDWLDWLEFIQKPGCVEKLHHMLMKYKHIQNILEADSQNDFFRIDEDYSEFLQYQISENRAQMICEFNHDRLMERLIIEIFKNPNFIQLPFLKFLIENGLTKSLEKINRSQIEKLIMLATMHYFSALDQQQNQDNAEAYYEYFQNLIELGVGIAHDFVLDDLMSFIMNQRELWPFMHFERWNLAISQNGIFRSFITNLMLKPIGITLLKHLMVNQKLSYREIFLIFINPENLMIFSTTIFSDEFLSNAFMNSCIEDPYIYQGVQSFISNKIHFHFILKFKTTFERFLVLIEEHPDFWKDDDQISLWAYKKDCYISFILKILIEAQKVKEPDFHEKIKKLFLSGNPAFHEKWTDGEWIMDINALCSRTNLNRFTWMLTPIFMMIHHQHYHDFLEILLLQRPRLFAHIKGVISEEKDAEIFFHKHLSKTESGKNILSKMIDIVSLDTNSRLMNHGKRMTFRSIARHFFQSAPEPEDAPTSQLKTSAKLSP